MTHDEFIEYIDGLEKWNGKSVEELVSMYLIGVNIEDFYMKVDPEGGLIQCVIYLERTIPLFLAKLRYFYSLTELPELLVNIDDERRITRYICIPESNFVTTHERLHYITFSNDSSRVPKTSLDTIIEADM